MMIQENDVQATIDSIESVLRKALASRILAKSHDESIGPFERPILLGDERDMRRQLDALARHASAVDHQRVHTIQALERSADVIVDKMEEALLCIVRLRMNESVAVRERAFWRRMAHAWAAVAMVVMAGGSI